MICCLIFPTVLSLSSSTWGWFGGLEKSIHYLLTPMHSFVTWLSHSSYWMQNLFELHLYKYLLCRFLSGGSIKGDEESSCRFRTNTTSRSPCSSCRADGILCIWEYRCSCSLCSASTWTAASFHYRLRRPSWQWHKWRLLQWSRHFLSIHTPGDVVKPLIK